MMTHTGDGLYTCKECEKVFINPSSLKIHESSHTGERPYQCHVVKLLEHKMFSEFMKVLTVEEDPYKCKIFVKMFTSSYVQAHKLIHTGQKCCQ